MTLMSHKSKILICKIKCKTLTIEKTSIIFRLIRESLKRKFLSFCVTERHLYDVHYEKEVREVLKLV